MLDITIPIIFIIIILGTFSAALTEVVKKLIKKCDPKFYKTKPYEIIKLLMPIIFCLIIALLTPDSIYTLMGYMADLDDRVWFGVISGLLSGFSFSIFKKVLKGFGIDYYSKNNTEGD
jgi:H+/Cl- antiporter ClcA